MRSQFDEQLEVLNSSMIEMGAMVERAIKDATEALINQDTVLAEKVAGGDKAINNKEKDIESQCLRLLLSQQPVARDLRQISTALKIITDMERIADQAADISEICIELAGKEYIKELEHIPQMAKATQKMVTDCIDAFVRDDFDLAAKVVRYDDVVDDLFLRVKADMIECVQKDVSTCEQAFDLMQVAKYYERIGDHAVNIAKWVIFSITGRHMKKKELPK